MHVDILGGTQNSSETQGKKGERRQWRVCCSARIPQQQMGERTWETGKAHAPELTRPESWGSLYAGPPDPGRNHWLKVRREEGILFSDISNSPGDIRVGSRVWEKS